MRRQETHRRRMVRQVSETVFGFIVMIGLIAFCTWSICYQQPVKKPAYNPYITFGMNP